MKCVISKVEETQPGKTTVTLERGGTTLVFKGVPAQVCPNCVEAHVDEEITGQLLRIAEEAARAGVQVDTLNLLSATAGLRGGPQRTPLVICGGARDG